MENYSFPINHNIRDLPHLVFYNSNFKIIFLAIGFYIHQNIFKLKNYISRVIFHLDFQIFYFKKSNQYLYNAKKHLIYLCLLNDKNF